MRQTGLDSNNVVQNNITGEEKTNEMVKLKT
jgi:hypothetical protein